MQTACGKRVRGFRLRLLTPDSAVLAMLFGSPVPARSGNGLMITRGHARRILEHGDSGSDGRAGQTKTHVVVTVAGGVPVAVGRTQVLRFIVPGAAPQHPASFGDLPPLKGYLFKHLLSQMIAVCVLDVAYPAH